MHEGPTENRLGELGSLYKYYYYYYYNYYYYYYYMMTTDQPSAREIDKSSDPASRL